MRRLILFLVHVVVMFIAMRVWGQETGRIHTLFSVECQDYFDWQTVGLMNSYKRSGQPGPITRLLSCTDDEMKSYKGMHLAPTHLVPSMSQHPITGDFYTAYNKPAGVLHWVRHNEDAKRADWVVILDADMIVRGPIIPWQLGAEKGKPFGAYFGYLVGCDNILAQLHTSRPDLCDKVGGVYAMHIHDLTRVAPLWLSKTEEVRADEDHWATNITGDVYGSGWISEMYGYTFGAAEAGLKHVINEEVMIYPGYTPIENVEPLVLHYGLPFSVGNWSFNKFEHRNDDIVYQCGRIFDPPPYPNEVESMESDVEKRRGLYLNIECVNIINQGLIHHHAASGCAQPKLSKYETFLKSQAFEELTQPKNYRPKIHTLFSAECNPYFDWQTVGFMHSFRKSGQPGNVTRLLSCTDDQLESYEGHHLAPTHYVPSFSRHPLTGDWYPAINKPAAVLHWLHHAKIDAEFVVILDADMVLRGPITPWEFRASRGHPVSTPYEYLIGCDNVLAELHTRYPEACEKVGGVIIMHIDDLRELASLWLHKTEDVRADKENYEANISGDVFSSGWISEMYGYSFGAAEMRLRHNIIDEILIYPGYRPSPGVNYRVLHYGLNMTVGNWSFSKADWWNVEVVNKCWTKFPEPPDLSTMKYTDEIDRERDLLCVECVNTLNEALYLHHKRRNCADPNYPSPGVVTRIELQNITPKKTDLIAKGPRDGIFGSLKLWIVALWTISGFGFVILVTRECCRGRGRGRSCRNYKSKQKWAYSGFFDTHV